MTDTDLTIAPIDRAQAPRVLTLWEDAVRATHHFLSEDDIAFFRPLIVDALFGLDHLLGAHDARGELLAFVGLAGAKMEALFVDPGAHRRGIGTRLARHVIEHHGITQVDVNEQNPQAVAFYRRLGFVQVDRSPLDAMGKPFPILHLHLG